MERMGTPAVLEAQIRELQVRNRFANLFHTCWLAQVRKSTKRRSCCLTLGDVTGQTPLTPCPLSRRGKICHKSETKRRVPLILLASRASPVILPPRAIFSQTPLFLFPSGEVAGISSGLEDPRCRGK